MSATVRFEDGVPYVGDRAIRWASKIDCSDLDSPRRDPWRHRHFWLTFENGWELSVTWGSGAYGSNKNYGFGDQAWQEAATCVEIAAWPKDGGMIEWDSGDSVKGWVTADDLSALIDQMMTWPSHPPADFIGTIVGVPA